MILFDGQTLFEIDGKQHSFVRFIKPDKLMVWKNFDRQNGENIANCGGMDVRDIPIDTLKFLKVWGELSPELKKELESIIHQEKAATKELMQKARSARKKRYANVPREIVCIKCGAKQAVVPSVLVKKVEKIAQDRKILFNIDDYIKSYQCQKCKPVKRGRQPNPEFKNLPTELVCACGFKTTLNPYQLKAKAEKMGITIGEAIKNYKCQKCRPSRKGRKKVIK